VKKFVSLSNRWFDIFGNGDGFAARPGTDELIHSGHL
jgi:hypothetical protein